MSQGSLRGQGVSAAFVALTFLSPAHISWAASPSREPARLALGTVFLPERTGTLAKQEVVRLTPGVVTQEYSGDKVSLGAGDTLVVFMDRCPKGLAAINRQTQAVGLPLAVTQYDKRTVFVFIRDLEDALGDDPRLKIALGRLIAHELEHLRRQSSEHDKTGYFKACLTRDELLHLGARERASK